MNYTNELNFLIEIFEKNGVHARILGQTQLAGLIENGELFWGGGLDSRSLFDALRHGTLYRTTDALECHYKLLLLPEREEKTALMVGPYRAEPPSEERCFEIGERIGLSPQRQSYLTWYYMTVARLTEDSPLMTALSVFCERIFATPSYNAVELDGAPLRGEIPLTKTLSEQSVSDTMIDMKAMEERYAFENAMIRAVELGTPSDDLKLSTVLGEGLFENRISDHLRNAKNYCIIMNTLLRKAAERGGVHPIYLDRVSSGFAIKIEECESTSLCITLMSEMFRDYCRLVRKHSFKSYSPTVQRVILAIETDLSRELSTSALARSQGISVGYLSSVFKKETGKTLTEFIRIRRMEHAQYLLRSTALQIQSVALHCGIMDLQYFSKQFKRHTGKTPSEYRARFTN